MGINNEPPLYPYEGYHYFSKSKISDREEIFALVVSEAYLDISYILDDKSKTKYISKYQPQLLEILEYQKEHNICFICHWEVLKRVGISYNDWYTINKETNPVIVYQAWAMPVHVFIVVLKNQIARLIGDAKTRDLSGFTEAMNGYLKVAKEKSASTQDGIKWI